MSQYLHCLLAFTIVSITCSSARIQLDSSLDHDLEFIRTSCQVTLYPKVCVDTLSYYASNIDNNPINLANAALSVALKDALSASSALVKLSKEWNLSPMETRAMADCVENMGASVEEIRQSLAAMKDLKGEEFERKMSNVLTWVSAALTDEDTCMDSFEGNAMNGKVKGSIRKYILNVAQLTSNALALIKNISSSQNYSP